ncbi:prephenate dehydrogenase [Tautonia sociabilis]|uniref:Prephenate dehydrogenase/arogenate dehydrogenase family protein n=1 Tax=Tautonia sociabilis TaxID=2080755 RepID=A0A432MPK7_9BACT|nr:prephenate dehydrogenase/arogenate dehydrogenase family protein [Tautonia sociabilis]RUL89342.1 prephenate dehydrogenase/arogenate dehydrogenase family protein [Tautonia sociabilis]
MERFGTVAIAGVGLIGGSIGLALRRKGLADRVIGLGRDASRLDEAKGLGAIDCGTTDPARAVAEAEVIVVCTPTDRIATDIKSLAAVAPEHVLITDAGSAKRRIVEAVEGDIRAREVFVGAHPLAGSERRGAVAARADLLDGRVCALTPTGRTPADRIEAARRFWTGLGCRIVVLDPDDHDAALARTSHLPHVVAAALASSVPEHCLELAAGAYRDGTRVVASDADLWVAIFRENAVHLLESVAEFEAALGRFRDAIASDDPETLRSLWVTARERRRSFEDGPPA